MRIFCSAKDSHIFSTKNNKSICDIYLQNFNETLTSDIVNFEQLGPDVCFPDRMIPLVSISEISSL